MIDRTKFILDISAARALTREGRLQVELAELDYLLPAVGRGVEMSRLGGGIGPAAGETQLETDRRRIAKRIQKIKSTGERTHRPRPQPAPPRRGAPGHAGAGGRHLCRKIATSTG